MKSLEASESVCRAFGGLAPRLASGSFRAPPGSTPLAPAAAVAKRAPDRGHAAPCPLGDRAARILRCRTDPTRLETRTKESNMRASVRVANPDAQGNRVRPEPGKKGARPAERCGSSPLPSKSTHAGTRKMVNYACAG